MDPADRWWRAIGLTFTLAAAAVAVIGGVAPLIVLAAGGTAAFFATRAAATSEDRPYLAKAVMGTLALRAVLTTAIHVILAGRTPNASLFQDDAGYVITASVLSRLWEGRALSTAEIGLLADTSVAPGYVFISAVAFRILGENVLSLKILNTVVGVLWAPLLYRTMRNVGLPGARIAALLILVFPSLVLWSSLALKDAIAGAVMLAVIWSVTEALATGMRWPWIATIAALIALRDLRVYVFVIVALAWPVAMVLAASRRRAAVAAAALSFVLIFTHDAAVELLDLHVINGIATTRTAMAEGARSAFVRPPPVAVATPGFAFRVEVPGSTCDPAIPPRRHRVPAGSQLEVEGGKTSAPIPGAPSRTTIFVRPCDEIVMLPPEATATVAVISTETSPPGPAATPSPTPRPPLPVVRVEPARVNIVATPEPIEAGDIGAAAEADIRHLPIGMLYVLTAPFPLAASTAAELAFTPEMLLWYVLVALSFVGLAQVVARRQWRSAIAVMTLGGIFLVMSLVEGNVGTLVRHRAMLVPYVVMLAAFGAVLVLPRVAPFLQTFRTTIAQLRAT